MASVSQGTIVQWQANPLGEVVRVAVTGPQADTVEVTPKSQVSRGKRYSVSDIDGGTVAVTCRGTQATSEASVGLTGTLSITGPNLSRTYSKAILESVGWTASVGELQEYIITFKVT